MPNEQIPLFGAIFPTFATDREMMPLIAAEACGCGHCHTEHHRADLAAVTNPTTESAEQLCPDCVRTCETCGISHHPAGEDSDWYVAADSFNRRRASDSVYCEDHQFRCDDCRDRFAADLEERTNASGRRICESCSESYYTCEDCLDTIHSDDAHSLDGDDGVYCQSCYTERRRQNEDYEDSDPDSDDDSCDGRNLHDYSYKPRAVFHRAENDRSATFYGIELETDRHNPSTRAADIADAGIPESFYCKEDGSLTHGFEMVSHPGTWQHWSKLDWSFLKTLKRGGYRSYDTETCGMHVHVSKSALTRLDELKLLEFFKANDEFIVYISRRKRHLLKQWAGVCHGGRRTLIEKAKGCDAGEHSARYTAVNLVPEKTVEFRIFRGTLDAGAVMRNLAFVATIVQFVKSAGITSMTFDHYLAWLRPNACKVLGRGETATALVKWVAAYAGAADEGVSHADAA
jgi:hypothetical protein